MMQSLFAGFLALTRFTEGAVLAIGGLSQVAFFWVPLLIDQQLVKGQTFPLTTRVAVALGT